MTARRRPVLMALGLALLAPLVGEFLLGNTPISQLGALLLYLPLYGAGAVLVRECGRRLGGWPTMAVFAAAYALVEEGPVDQMIFNPGYLGLSSFAGYGEIRGVGISGTLVVYSLGLHTVWSICVPIAIVESFDVAPTKPWLRSAGLVVTATVFVLGCVALGAMQAVDLSFVGTPLQFAVSALAILALLLTGVLLGRRSPAEVVPGDPPRPLLVGLVAFAVTSGYWLGSGVPGLVLQVTWAAVVVAGSVILIRRWARRAGWDGRHQLALAAGAAATYALWFGPVQAVEAGTAPPEILVGALVFGSLVLVVVIAAARALRHREPLVRHLSS